jgi:hypothetical protein
LHRLGVIGISTILIYTPYQEKKNSKNTGIEETEEYDMNSHAK